MIDMQDPTCSVDGCAQPVHVRKRMLCRRHYNAWYASLDSYLLAKQRERAVKPPKQPRAPRLCTIAGCGRKLQARGWCMTHWTRWKETGDPQAHIPVRPWRNPPAPPTEPCLVPWCPIATADPDRICAYHRSPSEVLRGEGAHWLPWAVQNLDRSECWPWPFRRNQDGYGQTSVNGVPTRAHRHALALDGRPVSPGLEARHDCDNPPCVNPSHLREGTHYENMHDMIRRGRKRNRQGPSKPGTSGVKLSDADVREIRRRLASGATARDVAVDYSVSRHTIYGIRAGRSRASVRDVDHTSDPTESFKS